MILLGLGSNMGDREQNLQQALCLLEKDGSVRINQVSSIYETNPFGVMDQADFLNMAASVETHLAPEKLLQMCLNVEKAVGRIRTRHWGPRIIDIDLLVYDNVQMKDEALTLPHPEIARRAFVWVPLRDIMPQLQLADGRTVEELAADTTEISKQGVRLWKNIEWDSSKKCFV